MDVELNCLKFANLLELARLSAQGEDHYKEQERIIEHCRTMGIPFLATMPMRHRTRCKKCKVERGESIYHFENPSVGPVDESANTMFGKPAGLWVSLETQQLHEILAHNQKAPEVFMKVLSSVAD